MVLLKVHKDVKLTTLGGRLFQGTATRSLKSFYARWYAFDTSIKWWMITIKIYSYLLTYLLYFLTSSYWLSFTCSQPHVDTFTGCSCRGGTSKRYQLGSSVWEAVPAGRSLHLDEGVLLFNRDTADVVIITGRSTSVLQESSSRQHLIYHYIIPTWIINHNTVVCFSCVKPNFHYNDFLVTSSSDELAGKLRGSYRLDANFWPSPRGTT